MSAYDTHIFIIQLCGFIYICIVYFLYRYFLSFHSCTSFYYMIWAFAPAIALIHVYCSLCHSWYPWGFFVFFVIFSFLDIFIQEAINVPWLVSYSAFFCPPVYTCIHFRLHIYFISHITYHFKSLPLISFLGSPMHHLYASWSISVSMTPL